MWPFKKEDMEEANNVKIVGVKFGMQVSYEVVGGKKGNVFTAFYESFSGMNKSIRKELIKIVFTGKIGP